jgi:tetratricopeptide (TPR) repeat protein
MVPRHLARTALHILVVTLSASFVLASCSQYVPDWLTNLEEARHLCAAGNLDQAKALLQKTRVSVLHSGGCPAPFFRIGQSTPTTYTEELAALCDCFAAHGLTSDAESLLKDAISLAKSNPDRTNVVAPMRALASLYEKQKDYKAAEPVRVEILSLRQANLEDQYALGDCYLIENKLAQAESIYKKALAIETKQSVKSSSLTEHLNKLGRCYFLRGDLSEAEKVYKQALDYDPLYHESDRGDSFTAKDLRPMAELYYAKGDLIKAEAYYRQSLSGTPEYSPGEQAEILTDYAKVLRRMHRVKEAEIREDQAHKKSLDAAETPHKYAPQSYE